MKVEDILRSNKIPKIKGTCGIEFPEKGKLAYLANRNYLGKIMPNAGAIILVSKSIYNDVKGIPGNEYIAVDNPVVPFSQIHNLLNKTVYFQETGTPKKGRNCRIGNVIFGKNTVLGDNAVISDFARIGSNVRIGSNTSVSAHAVIYDNVTIGSGCVIEAGAVLGGRGFRPLRGDGKLAGNRKLTLLEHVGGLTIGNKVKIGSRSAIDRGTFKNTKIGDNAILGCTVYIAHNVEVGKNTVIGDMVCVAGSAVLGKCCTVGSSASIRDRIAIGNNVVIGQNAVVVSPVADNAHLEGFYAGEWIIRN